MCVCRGVKHARRLAEHEKGVTLAENNSSHWSALQTSQVLHISTFVQLKHEPINCFIKQLVHASAVYNILNAIDAVVIFHCAR